MADKITFFNSGNGDSILIEAHNLVIMTDINYRSGRAQDENDQDAPDFAPQIRKACNNDHLDIFVLTHPDQDHLGGYCELFHTGAPEDWDEDPKEGEVKIVVDEIWCSPYAVEPNYETETSKPVLKEIKRRKKLQGTEVGKKDGNRLVVMDTTSHPSDNDLNEGISYCLLAPTVEEADIPESDDPECPNSSNSSSLVIRWTVNQNGKESYVLLGGDSTVDVWNRIYDDYETEDAKRLNWHIMLAPHHCSRHSVGTVENPDTKDEKFVSSEKAKAAMEHKCGKGYVVSSSREFGEDTPPSKDAREIYEEILDGGVFLCTAEEGNVEFTFTSSGPSKAINAAPYVVSSSSSAGGGYGQS